MLPPVATYSTQHYTCPHLITCRVVKRRKQSQYIDGNLTGFFCPLPACYHLLPPMILTKYMDITVLAYLYASCNHSFQNVFSGLCVAKNLVIAGMGINKGCGNRWQHACNQYKCHLNILAYMVVVPFSHKIPENRICNQELQWWQQVATCLYGLLRLHKEHFER